MATAPTICWRLAASVESQSEHPIAAAIVTAARSRGLRLSAPGDVQALPGLGVEGRVQDAGSCAARRGSSPSAAR